MWGQSPPSYVKTWKAQRDNFVVQTQRTENPPGLTRDLHPDIRVMLPTKKLMSPRTGLAITNTKSQCGGTTGTVRVTCDAEYKTLIESASLPINATAEIEELKSAGPRRRRLRSPASYSIIATLSLI